MAEHDRSQKPDSPEKQAKCTMYSSITQSISVEVQPNYLAQESDPANSRYFWTYHVNIKNNGRQEVQLLSRYWRNVDEQGHLQEVRGEGVVGEKPVLAPGDAFEYTSGCPLTTPSGIMSGSYQMVRTDGDLIEVAIPAFSLDVPGSKLALN